MRISRRVVMVVLSLAVVLLSSACTPAEEDAFKAVNGLRNSHSLRWYDWNENAYNKAVAWSNHMADEGQLSHSNLRENLPGEYRTVGENVAYGGTLEAALAALESSPPHRANMLSAQFTAVAIGVVERDGRVWVTQVFTG